MPLLSAGANCVFDDVFGIHLQAGDNETKLCQIAELADFMAVHMEPIPVLLFGDEPQRYCQ